VFHQRGSTTCAALCIAALLTMTSASVVRGEPSTGGSRALSFSLVEDWLVVVPVLVNGRGPYSFVIDTGATGSAIDPALADELKLEPVRRVEVVTARGSVLAPVAEVDLVLGTYRFTGVSITRMELSVPSARHPIRGVLGQDVLSKVTLTIDYETRRLVLSRDGPCRGGDARLPFTRVHDRPLLPVQVTTPGRTRDPMRMVLDSAAEVTVLYNRHPHVDASASEAVVLWTHHGPISARKLFNARLDTGSVSLKDTIHLLDSVSDRAEDGLLPAALFGRVCIDSSRSLIALSACRITSCQR
jgi:predicted aspartyl protease